MTDDGRDPSPSLTSEARPVAAGDLEGRGPRVPRPSFTLGWALKVLFLGSVNAIALYGVTQMWAQKWWPGIVVVTILTLAIDFAYLSKRAIPAKYLIPGTIFAVIFQVIPVLYTGYIGLTNFSVANRLTKEQALTQIRARVSNVPGSLQYRLQIVAADGGAGELAFFLTDPDGNHFIGTADDLDPVPPNDAPVDDTGKLTAEVLGFSPLALREIADRQSDIAAFQVISEVGVIRTVTATTAAVYVPLFEYDEDADRLTSKESGVVYGAVDGRFVSPDGESVNPGWQEFVGFDNFTKVLTSQAIRGPFLRVFVWNYVFAILSVILTFAVGLALAVSLNHPTLRGKRIYRSLLIVPYALPSFMTALIWAGMLNQEFGIINETINANVPWLRDPTLAKVSVLLVNTWLGFPYMFLITTGALQAMPEELKEAALIDGANPRQAFRRVVFPLLMVAVAPLLIASFAFNFNNFNIIFLLNRGGPPIEGALTPAGHTDILISYTYRLAFESGRGAQWGFASAIAIFIFIMVAGVSAISFRRTRALEELH
jgi:arabinogalactan oligomer/maltooligosaccharide transport system permease protein